MGHSELLLAEALRGVRRDSVSIHVKFGVQRDPGGAFIGYDASPGGGQDRARVLAAVARHGLGGRSRRVAEREIAALEAGGIH